MTNEENIRKQNKILDEIWKQKISEGFLPENVDCPAGVCCTKNIYCEGFKDGVDAGIKNVITTFNTVLKFAGLEIVYK